ncbi:MAG TPA: nucleoside monophosphate kinase [Rubrobacteraceae bacterium]|nr:nucleoside monophosphate kinase [Rubrobacteraceae bacterium]
MKIALLGPVGVGKGTQAQRVAGRLNYVRVSTGDLVRDQIEANTELGQELKGYSDQGDQVPDETIMNLIRVHLQPAGAWILDGVPRTVEQARALDKELEKHGTALDKVIMLEGPNDEDLIERVVNGRRQSLATGRVYHLEYDPPPDPVEGQDPGPFVQREDDTEEALRRQLEAYRKEAEAIKEHYEEKGILTIIDADQEVEKTTENILEALGHPQQHP